MLTEAGPVELEVPRHRESSFEPKIVAKRQRRLTGVEDVISLSAKGLTTGETSAHMAEVYGAARQRWSNRGQGALNAFEITFDGRLSAGRK